MTTTRDLPVLPALVGGHVWHRRRGPIPDEFRHRAYQWLVDLDELPDPPWYLRPVVGFHARDHLGGTGPEASPDIKHNVERFLAHRGVCLGPGGRVVMLANARVFGYVFDPLTVFWCFGTEGVLQCVIAEVHNTYGQRHAYVLGPSPGADANLDELTVDKLLYVSPFNDVSGRYVMRFELTRHHVAVTISLVRRELPVFDASFTGVPTQATNRTITRFALRMPAMSQKVSALIRFHGVRLWLRRLPIVPRPEHVPQEGAS